ncbi:MAG TPA: HRDC domain-containing protein [Candidatus Binatia bacterium]|nr:HRDC domain-containing protein [Candidatus Binatia bacterium]
MMPAAPYVWIDSARDLEQAADRLSRADALAVDTEADSFYHYFHKCCLIQIADGDTVYLVDPLALKRLEPLGEALASRRSVKVLHAAEQDVLYLRRDFGFHLEPLFDTMIAAQLLGKKGIGLASLLLAYFEVKLDKGSQRDDWSCRPLSERQKTYAADDVRHLVRLSALLRAELDALGRLPWAEEEFGLVARRAWEPRVFDPDMFWGVKGARDLAPRDAAVLRELYAMRDRRAVEADLSPFRIVSDEALLALAKKRPQRGEDLGGVRGVTPLVRRRIGDEILQAVSAGLAVPESDLPVPPRGQSRGNRRSALFQARLERLRAWRLERATALGIDPGVLFPQSTLEALASAGPGALDAPEQIPGLRSWRAGLIRGEAGRLLG